MEVPVDSSVHEDWVRAFVVEVLRTGIMLSDLLGGLLDDLPDDAFPGEDPAEVLLERLIGTIRPVAEAAGRGSVDQTTALLDAVADRTVADLRAACELAGQGNGRSGPLKR